MNLIDIIVNVILFIILPVVVLVYWWVRQRLTYWKRRNVPSPEPKGFAGNMTGVGTEISFMNFLHELYNEYKDKTPAVGFYMSVIPNILITDPELAKTIFIKDFSKFQGHVFYYNERDDPISAHIFNLDGAKWRFFRNKLSPTFTTGKLKMMYSTIEQIGDRFVEVLNQFSKEKNAFEVKDLSMKFTTDVVGSTAFGIEINSLGGEGKEMFGIVKKLLEVFSGKNAGLLFKMTFQNLSRMLRLPLLPREVSSYFMSLLKQTVEYREKNNVNRNDFLQLLLQLKNKGYLEGEKDEKEIHKLTFEQIAAQAFIFLFAGFETSSTAMNFSLYLLATHQDIQDKARKEINEKIAKHNGSLSYEALMEMEYLNQVFNESMRMFPPVFMINRVANVDYTIPNTNMTIGKGTQVYVSANAFHNDPKYFPDPEKFDPERFSKENIDNIYPCTFLPFGEGPRLCIGNRFAQLQSRFGLALLLKKFKVTLNEKTQVPLQFDKDYPGWSILGGIWLNVETI